MRLIISTVLCDEWLCVAHLTTFIRLRKMSAPPGTVSPADRVPSCCVEAAPKPGVPLPSYLVNQVAFCVLSSGLILALDHLLNREHSVLTVAPLGHLYLGPPLHSGHSLCFQILSCLQSTSIRHTYVSRALSQEAGPGALQWIFSFPLGACPSPQPSGRAKSPTAKDK